jgi:SAM-dependent methyltransferase
MGCVSGQQSKLGVDPEPTEASPKDPKPHCPICGSSDTRLHREDVHDFEYFVKPATCSTIRACPECRSQFLYPRPSSAELVDFYPRDYHAYNEDHGGVARLLVGLRARVRARHYRKLLGATRGHLFDVGAGDCRHFDELRRFCDLECAGVELNSEMAAAGRDRGFDIADGTLEELDLSRHEGRYDLVSMNHALEHVVEPQVVVERAARLLKPGGHLLGQLPSLTSWEARIFGRRWGGYHYPRHLQMFSRAGLGQLLQDGGFGTVRIRTAPHVQTALSLQNLIVGWGWRPKMRYGKTPIYSALLLTIAPFELVAFLADRGGIVDFSAQNPR